MSPKYKILSRITFYFFCFFSAANVGQLEFFKAQYYSFAYRSSYLKKAKINSIFI